MQITYTPASGPPVLINGIFDEVYVLAKDDPEAGVETLGPAVFLRLSSLPIHPELDDPTIVISGAPTGDGTYRVTQRLPAGLGAIVLALRRVT